MKESKLTGDIKGETELNPERVIDFLIELETLMMIYKIDKVDVAWKKF